MEKEKIISELYRIILEKPEKTVEVIVKVPKDFFLDKEAIKKFKKAVGIWNLFLRNFTYVSVIQAEALDIYAFIFKIRAELIPKIAKLPFVDYVEENVILSIPPEQVEEKGTSQAKAKSLAKLQEIDTSKPNWWLKYYGFDKLHEDEKFNKGKGVKLGIGDTGAHRKNGNERGLGNRVKALKDFTGTSRTYPLGRDDNGHGNTCSLLMASSDSHKLGVAPEAEIYSAKVLDESGRGLLSWIVNGINWLVQMKVHGINMSFGASEHVPMLCEAVEKAWSEGIFCSIAAGNSGKWPGGGPCEGSIFSPGDAKDVMVVGALGKKDPDQVQTWSSRPSEDQKINLIMVNGVGIDVCDPRLKDRSGTSFASPKIMPLGASMVALLGISNDKALKAICDTGRELSYKNEYGPEGGTCLEGDGAVQAYKAWKLASSETPTPVPPTPVPGKPLVVMTVTANGKIIYERTSDEAIEIHVDARPEAEGE